MFNHLHLHLVLTFLWSLFLSLQLQFLWCPFFYFLLDLLNYDSSLFFRVFLLDFFEDFESFVTFLSIWVKEKPFVITLKRVDILPFEKIYVEISFFIVLKRNLKRSLLEFMLHSLLSFLHDALQTLNIALFTCFDPRWSSRLAKYLLALDCSLAFTSILLKLLIKSPW